MKYLLNGKGLFYKSRLYKPGEELELPKNVADDLDFIQPSITKNDKPIPDADKDSPKSKSINKKS